MTTESTHTRAHWGTSLTYALHVKTPMWTVNSINIIHQNLCGVLGWTKAGCSWIGPGTSLVSTAALWPAGSRLSLKGLSSSTRARFVAVPDLSRWSGLCPWSIGSDRVDEVPTFSQTTPLSEQKFELTDIWLGAGKMVTCWMLVTASGGYRRSWMLEGWIKPRMTTTSAREGAITPKGVLVDTELLLNRSRSMLWLASEVVVVSVCWTDASEILDDWMLVDRARVSSAEAEASAAVAATAQVLMLAGGAEAAVGATTADDVTDVAGKVWKPDFQIERGCNNTSRVRSNSRVGDWTSVMLSHVFDYMM